MHYNGYQEGSKVGKPQTLEVDLVIGGDGANSRVAREMNAGEYDYAIAFQVRPAPAGPEPCQSSLFERAAALSLPMRRRTEILSHLWRPACT